MSEETKNEEKEEKEPIDIQAKVNEAKTKPNEGQETTAVYGDVVESDSIKKD